MRAVVFDFDGVLVDSEPLHYRALRDALLPEGVSITEDEYRREYLAYDDWESIRIALERHGQAYAARRVEALAERKAAVFDALLSEVPFYDGARELVSSLAAVVPLAIASGARRDEIERILRAGGLREAFGAVVGADDVTRSKPDPEPYLLAVARLSIRSAGLEPKHCLAFEDSGPGIAAARGAGLKVVGVAHTYPPAALGLAHRVVDSLHGLDAAGARALFEAC
jgi:beta-phosphoglucomutase